MAQVKIEIVGDDSDAQRVMKRFAGESEKSGKRVKDVFAGLQLSQYVDRARQAVGDFAKGSVDAYVEAEGSASKLQATLDKFPKLADTNLQELQKLNSALALKTKYDDDATASGQEVLAGFGLTGAQLKELTPLMQDVATKTGKSLPAAAKLMGRAFLGSTGSLKQLGIDYKKTGDKSKDLANITALLRKQVGGFAEKEGKTAAGQAAIVDNKMGEMQETIGQQLLPAQMKLKDVQSKVLDVFTKLPGPLQAGVVGFAGLATTVGPLVPALSAIGPHLGGAMKAFGAFSKMLMTNPYVLIIAATIAIGILIFKNWDKIRRFFGRVWGAISGIFTRHKAGILRVVKALARGVLFVLTGGMSEVVLAFVRNWDKVKRGVSAVIGWVRRNWPVIIAVLTGPLGIAVLLIKRKWNTIVGFVKELPGRLRRVASGAWNWVWEFFRENINKLIRGWNSIEFKLPSKKVFGVTIGGGTIGTPDIPQLHSGGRVTAEGFVNWKPGEELAFMPRGATVAPLGAGFGAPLVGSLTVIARTKEDAKAIVKAVRAELQKVQRRNRTTGMRGSKR